MDVEKKESKSENLSEAVVIELKDFISLRDKLITDRSGYKARIKEQNATRKYAKHHLQNKIQLRQMLINLQMLLTKYLLLFLNILSQRFSYLSKIRRYHLPKYTFCSFGYCTIQHAHAY